MREVHTRLARLYAEYAIAHMPSEAIQQQPLEQTPFFEPARNNRGDSSGHHGDMDTESGYHRPSVSASTNAAFTQAGATYMPPSQQEAEPPGDQRGVAAPSANCDQFVGNAAVYGDCFQWHIDADPAGVVPTLAHDSSDPPCCLCALHPSAHPSYRLRVTSAEANMLLEFAALIAKPSA